MTNRRVLLKLLLVTTLLGVGICMSLVAHVQSADGRPAPTPPPNRPISKPTPTDWIILPQSLASASQADVGAEIWRLVCQDCHGNRGQGLTADWRAQWGPADQNCWQTKCHAANHPPEGFVLPRSVPSVVGPNALDEFDTALSLHNYICTLMPWYNPGSLKDQQCWQVTAFLLRQNGISPLNMPLDRTSAAALLLHPPAAKPTLRP
jgi:hypothetical protein